MYKIPEILTVSHISALITVIIFDSLQVQTAPIELWKQMIE